MAISIRRAGVHDAGRLSLVAQAAFLEAFAEIIGGDDILAHARNANGETAFANWLAQADGALWLAETANGAPVGYAGLAAPDLPIEVAAGDIELKRIYVLHPYLGGGIAFALMQAALAHAEACGRRRVLLGVKDDNRRAIAFYFKHGFAQIGVRRFQVGATFYHDLILARPL